MATIETALDALVAHLTACLTVGGNGLMPGVVTVQKGDYLLADASLPAVTVDWDGESLGGDRGLAIFSDHQVAFRLYVYSIKKGDDHNAMARTLYQSADGLHGLRRALLSFPGGSGFTLTISQAHKIRRETRTELRFSAGIEVLGICKIVSGR